MHAKDPSFWVQQVFVQIQQTQVAHKDQILVSHPMLIETRSWIELNSLNLVRVFDEPFSRIPLLTKI